MTDIWLIHDWYMTDMWLIYCWCWCWKSQNTRNTHTFQKYTKNSKDFLFKNGSWVDGQMVPLDHTFDGFKVAQTFHRLSFLSAGYHTLIFSFFIGDHKSFYQNIILILILYWLYFMDGNLPFVCQWMSSVHLSGLIYYCLIEAADGWIQIIQWKVDILGPQVGFNTRNVHFNSIVY